MVPGAAGWCGPDLAQDSYAPRGGTLRNARVRITRGISMILQMVNFFKLVN